ncbi:MAG: hypothetical protein Pg6A_03330 [Termitinemataceae bacterium]|nr:MAG: hypothetical protein Pg6A_03330 [Termitinemataceae bacterium]
MSINRAIETQIQNLVKTMPALPQTADHIYRICQSYNVQAGSLYKLICLDPFIFCHTQALFNSYFPKLNERFYSIAEIIIMLNINTVKNYIVPFAQTTHEGILGKTISKNFIEANNKLFLHSVAVGITSRFIAGLRGVDALQFEYYYSAGFLHDIGKFFFIEEAGHSEVGQVALKQMSLYSGLQNVIAFHHDALKFSGKDAEIVRTVALADCWVKRKLELKMDSCEPKFENALINKLELNQAIFNQLENLVPNELKRVSTFIKSGAV